MKPYFALFNPQDICEGDVYVWSYNACKDNFVETNIAEVVITEDGRFSLKHVRGCYWKLAYENIYNNYLLDFKAVRIYRKCKYL